MQRYLAFDLGAESGRAVAGTFSGDRVSLEEIHRFPNQPVWMHGSMCWDFPALLREMQEGLVRFIQRFDDKPAGISCDSWGVDFGLLDSQGNLLGVPVHYRDPRTNGMPDAVFARVPKEEIYATTGIQLMQLNTLFQIESLQASGNVQWKAADKFLTIADLVHYFFCGSMVVESSLASTTHLYDAGKRDWSRDLIERLGYPMEKFPEVVPSGTRIGTLDDDLADSLRIPRGRRHSPVIASLSHDTAAAVAAVPARRGSNWAYLSSGTWSLLGVELDEPVLSAEACRWSFTNEGGAEGTVRFLKNIMGLWILQECKRTWDAAGHEMSYGRIAALAEAAPSRIAAVDPDDPRFFPPGDMPSRIAEYCDQTGQAKPEGPGSIARCVLESLALKYRVVLERITSLTGVRVDVVHVVGGGGRNRLLNQLIADVCEVEVLVGPTEATALGNVLAQAVALDELDGLWAGRELAAQSFEIERYTPSGSGDWEQAYRAFRERIAD